MTGRTKILMGVLVVLLGVAGGLFKAGYWDTWQDRRDDLYTELLPQIQQGVGDEALGTAITGCMADNLIKFAAGMECIHSGLEPALPQIGQCIMDTGTEAVLQQLAFMCSMKALMEGQGQVPAAPPTP